MTKRTWKAWTQDKIDQLRDLTAAGYSDSQCADIMGLTKSQVTGIRWRQGIRTNKVYKKASEPPEELLQVGPTITIAEAARRYRASDTTAAKWYRLLGIRPRARNTVVVTTSAGTTATYKRGFGLGPGFSIPARDWTLAASAQLTLQRHMPCFKASTLHPNAPADQWVVGGTRLTESEMIQKAERYGFKVAA